MKGETLLRALIREFLGGPDPRATGKDVPAGNLYSTGHGEMDAAQRGSHSDILSDEDQDEEQAMQGKMLAATVLIIADDGKVLAVSRRDDPTAFGLPGGKVDPGETPAEAAARELEEETGLTATNLKPVFVREEGDGYTTTTFVGHVTGNIRTDEEGVVRWVHRDVLFNGPFGEYNKKLFAKLGL